MSQRDNDLIEDILDAAGKLAEIVSIDEAGGEPPGL